MSATAPSTRPPPANAEGAAAKLAVLRRKPVRLTNFGVHAERLQCIADCFSNPEARKMFQLVFDRHPKKEEIQAFFKMSEQDAGNELESGRKKLRALLDKVLLKPGTQGEVEELRGPVSRLSESIELILHRQDAVFILADGLARLAGFGAGLRVNDRRNVSPNIPDILNLSESTLANFGRRFEENPKAAINGMLDEMSKLIHSARNAA